MSTFYRLLFLVASLFSYNSWSQVPWECDGTAYLSNSVNGNDPTTLTLVDAETGVLLGSSIIIEEYNLNAIGYNIQDDLIYGAVTTTLNGNPIPVGNIITIDANGDVFDVGVPTSSEAPADQSIVNWNIAASAGVGRVSLFAGEVDNAGNMYFFGTNNQSEEYLVTVDLVNMTYKDVVLSLGIRAADLAFASSTGLLYGLKGGEIIEINPNTGVQTILNPTGDDITGFGAGGAWANLVGEVFFYNNSTGNFYKYNTLTNDGELSSGLDPFGFFDATSCFPTKLEKEIITPINQHFPGGSVTYKFTIENGNTTPLVGDFEDIIGAGFTWDTTSVNPPNPGGGTVTINGNNLTISNITVPTLLNTNFEPFSFTVTAFLNEDNPGGNCLSNTATFTSGAITYISDDPTIFGNNDATEVCLSYCYKDATIGPETATNVGITTLNRSKIEANSENWPYHINSAQLAIESKEKGFVITRLSTTEINNLAAEEGMLVWDTVEECLKLYDGTDWFCIVQNCQVP